MHSDLVSVKLKRGSNANVFHVLNATFTIVRKQIDTKHCGLDANTQNDAFTAPLNLHSYASLHLPPPLRIHSHFLPEPYKCTTVNSTSDRALFKRDCLNSLVDFIDNVLAAKDWLLIRAHVDTIQKTNYRMDRQGELLRNPDRYRHAIQVQAGAKDPLLKGLARSKGAGGGSFGKSKPTLTQVEIECGSCVSVEQLKQAFYASMIPQKKYLRLGYLHHVVVRKNGTRQFNGNFQLLDPSAART